MLRRGNWDTRSTLCCVEGLYGASSGKAGRMCGTFEVLGVCVCLVYFIVPVPLENKVHAQLLLSPPLRSQQNFCLQRCSLNRMPILTARPRPQRDFSRLAPMHTPRTALALAQAPGILRSS